MIRASPWADQSPCDKSSSAALRLDRFEVEAPTMIAASSSGSSAGDGPGSSSSAAKNSSALLGVTGACDAAKSAGGGLGELITLMASFAAPATNTPPLKAGLKAKKFVTSAPPAPLNAFTCGLPPGPAPVM